MSTSDQEKTEKNAEEGDQLHASQNEFQQNEEDQSKQENLSGLNSDQQFKSTQVLPNNSSQFQPNQQNLQYYDKHDYNQEPGQSSIKKNVVDAYTKLHDYVQDIHEQITEKMKKSEEDFLYVYKEQMYTIQKELKALKKKMDDELLRQKANDKMNILTEERDYFKAEALRLDRTCKEQEREIEELQFKQKVLTEDKNYYEGFVIETKKENKALKSELLQLYKFKVVETQQLKESTKLQGTQQQNVPLKSQIASLQQSQVLGQPDNIYFQESDQVSEFRPMTQNAGQRNAGIGGAGGAGGEEIFLSEAKWNGKGIPKNTNTIMTTLSSNLPTGQNFFTSSRAQTNQSKQRPRQQDMTSVYSGMVAVAGAQFDNAGLSEMEILRQNEAHNLETIKQLRGFLEKDRQQLKKLKATLSQINAERSDLEQILMECINETKKDINRRRAMQKAEQIALQNGSNGNLKKSLTGQIKNTPQISAQEEILFSQFNAKDKMKTLRAYISSDKFLDQIYQITFGHSKVQKFERDKLLPETGGDKDGIIKDKVQTFKLTESWRQDAQVATQLYNNFRGFKYSFKPQTTQGCRTISNKDLKSPLFNMNDKPNKSNEPQLQEPMGGGHQPSNNIQLAYKQKLYKEVCKEFSTKNLESKM